MTASREVCDKVRDLAGDESEPYGHLVPLLALFAALGEEDPRRRAVRDRLVAGYLPVVRHIARRYAGRGEPTADLEQVGAVGLLGALERFDPERGTSFLSFAVPTITGEVRRYFRDHSWSMRVSRRLKDLHGPVRDAVASLSGALGRAPRPSEIAAHLDVAVEDIVDVLGAAQAYTADSLDALVGGSEDTVGDLLGRVDTALETAQYRQELRAALAELPERERTILVLRFFEDMTQTQIAAQMGISQMRVSRLLTQTLETLRNCLDTELVETNASTG
ncbi:MAG: polymerase sigma-B factor [Pseudonocardiales bacterium]|nr:polymerase sigma-B factor [Pseudonocardiales bacterium]